MNNIQSIQSKNRETKWKLDPLLRSGRLTSTHILTSTPGVTKYATDVKSALETVFNSRIENEIIKLTNIEWKRVAKYQKGNFCGIFWIINIS